jgi:plasmid stability protein
MKSACYIHDMANLQVRNFPDELHARLRHHAREHNRSMSAVVLSAVERELARGAWRERLAQRPPTDLDVDAAALVAEERAFRDVETE